jgi:transcriptional regulator with XRE-family HTH domain
MDTAQQIITEIVTNHALTDADVADRTGSTQPTIWRLRNGETKDCLASLYISLAQLREQLKTSDK